MTAQTNRLHVRGIGVHGWDGTEEGKGDYESEAALRKIFERFGYFQNAMVRHRVQDGKNTSWALVTMADEAAVERALAAHAKQPVMAGRQELVLTRFSKAQGESSTGGMKQQVRVVLPSVLFSATSQHRVSMQMADAERKALALEHVKQKLRSIAYVLKGQSPVELFRSFDVSLVASLLCGLSPTDASICGTYERYWRGR